MTKTVFRKKLLLIATITVLVTGLTLAATTLNDAEAKKGPPSGAGNDLKCKDNIGSFMVFGLAGPFVSTGQSKCAFIGNAAFTTVTMATGAPGISGAPNCIELMGAGPGGHDGYAISKKGFFTFDLGTGPVPVPLEQCFFLLNGVTPTAGPPDGFCSGPGIIAWKSTLTGSFGITGGLINDKKTSTPVLGGSGMISSAVDHCAGITAPGGDSAVTTFTGTIDFP